MARRRRSAFLRLVLLATLFGPNPPIIVSRETTFITELLGPDGLPDYEKYALDKSREGVTPENNAAVLLWQVIWPGDLEPSDYESLTAEIGLEQFPSETESLQSIHSDAVRKSIATWLIDVAKRQANQDTLDIDAQSEIVDEIIDRAMDQPWTGTQVPPLAEWVTNNRDSLDMAIKATGRSRYYSPSPSLLDDSPTLMIAILFPDLQGVRYLARALSARAMWHLGEGRIEEAWRNLLAVHRLARLVGQGHTLVEQLIAIACSDLACNGTVTLLDQVKVNGEWARHIQEDLANLDRISDVPEVLDQMERLQALDAVLYVRSYGLQAISSDPDVISLRNPNPRWAKVDWNIVLQEINYWYDRIAGAAKLPHTSARKQEQERCGAELLAESHAVTRPAYYVASRLSRRKRSHAVASVVACSMLPALGTVTTIEDRANTQVDLVRLAAVLAIYRTKHDKYPDSVKELVPDVLPQLPVDHYYETPLIYDRHEEGYLLYSAGANARDDGGSNELRHIFAGHELDIMDENEVDKVREQIPKGADDISIRVPRPPFKLPEPASN